MKKIIPLLLLICLLTGCKSNDTQSVLTFFDCLNNTLQVDSGQFDIELIMNNEEGTSKINTNIQFDQTKTLELAANIDLEANDNSMDDFASFYIKNGNTYLNYMGVTSQSTLKNLGINNNDKLNVYNPFLSFTDQELIDMFTKVKIEDNTYILEADKSKVSTLLDSYGTISIDTCDITATLEDDHIKTMDLVIKGDQTIQDQGAIIDLTIHIETNDLDDIQIDFPDDLASY